MEPELVLKATPPRGQKHALARTRLSFDAPALTDKVAIAVQASAGFGKTMLLAQWRREWLSRGAIVAWLTLDERDTCARFAQGLAAAMAMGSGRSGFSSAVERLLGSASDEIEALTGWLADVVDLGGDAVLVLDELHLLPETTLRHSLTYLLHNAPANLRIVMAGRGRTELPVAELLAHGQFAVVTQDDLLFSAEESVALLAARFGSRIDPDMSMRLHGITQGWALGLQLAVAALEKSTDLGQAINGLSAKTGDIRRYFVDCLVERLPVRLMEFLTHIAFLDVVHPQLAELLSGNADAADVLRDLCASTPIFIEGVDTDWVRIHPLAREFLLERFDALSEAERLHLHGQAATWLAAEGLLEEAARHALLAGHAEQAHEMVDDSLYRISLRGHFGRVLEWFDRLPISEVRSRPRLRVAVAWALAMGERHAEALVLVGLMRSDPNLTENARCEADAIAAAAAYFADRLDESSTTITPWFGAPPRSLRLRAILAGKEARLLLFRGEPELARRCLQTAPPYAEDTLYDAVRGYGDWVMGLSYLWEGRLQLAEDSLRMSVARAEQDLGRRSASAVTLAAGLAVALLARGAVQEATTVLANRLDMIERAAPPEAIVLGYICSARLADLSGQQQRAYDLLGALYSLGTVRDIPRFCIVALAEQIRMHAVRGHADTCLMLWRRLDSQVPEFVRVLRGMEGPAISLVVDIARGYVALVQQDWPQVQHALDKAATLAEGLRRGREIVQIKLLQALALKQQGLGGRKELNEALSLARDYGMTQVLADTHPDLGEWLTTASEPSLHSPVSVRSQAIVQETAAPVVSPSRLLTPKEREVLQLLARSLSNKQIAQALSVGEETVKWHVKNLFGKFQAGTRRHVVDRAYMLGIIENS